MPKKPKTWVLVPPKKPKARVPDAVKSEVAERGNALVVDVLKPKYVQPPPKNPRFNYIIDLWTKWHGSYFYFGATYACPGPTAISPTFEAKFARLEYIGSNHFAISYLRHNDKWWELSRGLTLDQCLKMVETDGHFIA